MVKIDCSDWDEFPDIEVVKGFINEFAVWHKTFLPQQNVIGKCGTVKGWADCR